MCNSVFFSTFHCLSTVLNTCVSAFRLLTELLRFVVPKPHYSWYRSHAVDLLHDNRATLIDYARITHSFPVCHGGGGAPDHGKAEVENAVAICIAAGGNCSISVDNSPYINEAEKLERRIDPRKTTPNELASLEKFKKWAVNVTRWAANASTGSPFDIKVGAVGFDQEQICGYCWSHADDGTCNASTFDVRMNTGFTQSLLNWFRGTVFYTRLLTDLN